MWEDSLTQPCVIIVNLQNILEIRLEDDQHATCIDLRHLINVFDIFSSGVPAETRKLPENSLYSLPNKRLSHSTVSDKLSTVVGVPTLVREYSECYQNSQLFAVTGISSTYYGHIQHFRLRTLGVPVSNSDS